MDTLLDLLTNPLPNIKTDKVVVWKRPQEKMKKDKDNQDDRKVELVFPTFDMDVQFLGPPFGTDVSCDLYFDPMLGYRRWFCKESRRTFDMFDIFEMEKHIQDYEEFLKSSKSL